MKVIIQNLRKNIRCILILFILCGGWSLLVCFTNDKSKKYPRSTIVDSTQLIELGRYLFYDNRLSYNNTKSCASCHDQRFAFTDGYRKSIGIYGDKLNHNSLPLFNLESNFSFNWNEPEIIRVEDQLHIPLFNDAPKELGLKNHEAEILHRFCSDSSYVYLFLRAFPEKAFPINFNNIIKSLAAFCLSIKSYNSDNDKGILTINAQKGKTLFYSEKYNCNNCHSGPNFNQFIGAKRPEDNFQKFGFSETGNKFRIPSLRNLSFTSPYLHDGSAESLLDVLNDYENANRYRNFGQRDVQDSSILTIQTKLDNQMSMEDKMNIIAFLLSLNDTTFVNNPQYKNPFNY